MDNYLRENDPYRGMNSAEDSIRPGFLSRAEGVTRAASALSRAEKRAANSETKQSDGSLSGAKANEEAARGFYSGSGRSPRRGTEQNSVGKNAGKRNLKGILKKGGPAAAIGGILIAAAGLISSAVSLMPVAIEEMIIEKFNSVGISSTTASDNFLNTQLNQGVLDSSKKRGESQSTQYGFSEYQVQQYAKQGIQVVGGFSCSGQSAAVMLYKVSGGYNAVVGSNCTGKLSSVAIANAADLSASDIKEQISVKEAFADAAFKTPYTTASKSWRGGSSGWFDKMMSDVTETKLNINRNRFARYISKSITKMSDEFKELAAANKNGIRDDGITVKEDGDTGEVDADSSGVGNNDRLSKTAEGISTVLNSKAVKAAQGIADIGCGVAKGIMAIYTVVAAYQNLQFLNLVTGFLESVDKMKAGEGDSSPIHEYGLSLTTAAATTDNEGNVVEGKESKTGMDSAGMSWLFGKNYSINRNDDSVKNVNFETIMSNLSSLTGSVGVATKTLAECGYVKLVSGTINLVSDAILFISTGGIGAAIKIFAKKALEAAAAAVIAGLMQPVINKVIKQIASVIVKDAATEWFGEDLGNALVSGANKYLGGNGTSGGQGPGSTAKVISYLNQQGTVIAEEAEYQRSVRSPFDITSQYTFLGSLAYSVIPFAYSSGGVMSVLKDVSSTVSNSLVGMLPTASAIDSQSVLTSVGECPLLDGLGIVGDAFCNPYVITDISTSGVAMEDVARLVHDMDENGNVVASLKNDVKNLGGTNFNDDGSIRDGSPLAKYTVYCGQRTSQYGVYDANIAAAASESKVMNVFSNIPVLDSVSDIVNGAKEQGNMGYINGQDCTADETSSKWENMNKWFARYNENERLLESIDPDYQSPATKLANQYYEENPLDQSFEGTLARFSGMTKEDVSDTLALIDYYRFLNEYEPEERYAFGPEDENGKEIYFESDRRFAQIYGLQAVAVAYADLRNRNFVA